MDLFEGNSTTLNCELAYSGSNPSSTWFHNGEEIESIDESEVRLAKKVVSFVAGPDHDQSRYSCRMSFGNVTEECSLVLDVKCKNKILKCSVKVYFDCKIRQQVTQYFLKVHLAEI